MATTNIEADITRSSVRKTFPEVALNQRSSNNPERTNMKNLKSLFIVAALTMGAAHAQTVKAPSETPMSADNKNAMASPAGDMTEAEVRKVDMDTKKITLKHGDIKNLDMPGMTMVFQVKDPAMLDKIKAGDKVRFKVEKSNGAIVVTDLQLAK